MNNYKIYTAILCIFLMGSCINDLDQEPLNKKVFTSDRVYSNPESYKQFLAKLYGALTLTGQRGEYGQAEIPAPDEGTTSFLRTYWSVQELTTDEAVTAWADAGLMEFNAHSWSSQNGYVQLLYQRIFINIAYCNEYIRQVPPRISGLPADMQSDVTRYVAEARFLRALYYYFAMDLWGNVPFVTEADETGAFLPKQIKRADLFEYIESELEEILPELAEPGQNEYARADKAAAWMLLAKIYLNSEVYLGAGQKRYTECLTYCNKILDAGYSLHDNYSELFRADNHLLRNEIIFPIAEDGDNTRNYGGVTFIIHGAVGGSEDPDNDFGIGSGGWSGHRITKSFAEKFGDVSGDTDSRAMFYTDGQKADIDNLTLFTEGYLSTKFKNLTSTGVKGKNATFVDTDFPLFRLADVYLMYAESVLRGGTGGDQNTALGYINDLRTRAYGDASGNISAGELTLDFILEERSRELYWEAQRRTDLIRFNMFSGDAYLWDWKGGVKAGKSTETKYQLLPIPASDIALNPNLEQNSDF
jgi:starch-binding outer membrane protein, SusD/RagB family